MEVFKVDFQCPDCDGEFQEFRIKPHRKSKVYKVCTSCRNMKDNINVASERYLEFGKGSCGNCIHFRPLSSEAEVWGHCGLGMYGTVDDIDGTPCVTPYVYSADTCPKQEDI